MKKGLLLGAMLAAMFTMQTFAAGININVDSAAIKFDEDSAEPFIENGTTFVPLRGVFEKMGYSVVWDGDNRQAILTGSESSDVIVITDGSSVAKAGGTEVDMGISTQIVNGRLMLPLRAVANLAQCQTDWDGETKTVSITTKATLDKEAAERERQAKTEADNAAKEQEQADKEKAAEKKAIEEARAAAKAAEDAAEAERNFDYTAYPSLVMEIADSLDSKLSEAYAVAVRSYVNNAGIIEPYSDRIIEYIETEDEVLADTTVKDEQAKVEAAFEKYYKLAKTASSYIKSASSATYSGESLSQSSKKGDRSLASSMNAYRKFQQNYENNEREMAAAKAELKAACEAYLAKLG